MCWAACRVEAAAADTAAAAPASRLATSLSPAARAAVARRRLSVLYVGRLLEPG